ncbi:MAG: class I SAM-dependent methyltransferase [Candidatus Phytoplasma sp.]|nr:class I SAM-dependent methyltransferase [Phytoplasma sp.]
MSHYFMNDSSLKDEHKQINITIKDKELVFQTNAGVFSKSGIDFGTKLLLEEIKLTHDHKTILDMGCGYGPIGIFVAKTKPESKVVMADVNLKALELARANAKLNQVCVEVLESDLFTNVSGPFDLIITNPPIRTGKQNIFKLYEDAYKNLNINGELWIVIQKKQGALSTIKKLEELFGNYTIETKKKGYYILYSKKTTI